MASTHGTKYGNSELHRERPSFVVNPFRFRGESKLIHPAEGKMVEDGQGENASSHRQMNRARSVFLISRLVLKLSGVHGRG